MIHHSITYCDISCASPDTTQVSKLEEELAESRKREEMSAALEVGQRNDQKRMAAQAEALESSQNQVGAVTRQVVRLEEKIALLEQTVSDANRDRNHLQVGLGNFVICQNRSEISAKIRIN